MLRTFQFEFGTKDEAWQACPRNAIRPTVFQLEDKWVLRYSI